MKKIKLLLKKIPLVLTLSVAALFSACFNSSSTPTYPPFPPSPIPTTIDPLSLASLKHRAYIGGSLIYNPSNSSLSQIAPGVKIAVRASKLEKKTEALYELGGASLRDAVTVDVDANGNWSNPGASESFADYIVEKEDSDIYGYITITAVDDNTISFKYSYYAGNNETLTTESYKIKQLNTSQKLGSTTSYVKWDKQKVPRKGFENARWLTFENSEDTMSACMYSCLSEVNGKPTSSLYGVNSDDDFIYIVGNRACNDNYYPTTMPSASEMVSYGDYIVDQNDYKMYAIAGDTSGGYSSAMKEASAYGPKSGKTSEDFIDFAYYLYQFPDPVNGPKALFDALPTVTKNNVESEFNGKAASYITKLNWVLCNPWSFRDIAEYLRGTSREDLGNQLDAADTVLGCSDTNPSIPGKYYNELDDWRMKIKNGNFDSQQIETELAEWLETMRAFMDEAYGESPDAYVDAPTMFSVYPDIAVDLGGDGSSASDYSANNAIPADLNFGVSKSLGPDSAAEKYEQYIQKREAIVKQFKDYRQIEIINKTAFAGLVGVNAAFGVKGSIVKNLGVKSGEFGIKGLSGVVFLKAEASNQELNIGKKSLLDEPIQKDLGAVNFSIGPVPCVFKTTLSLDFGFEVAYKTKPTKKYMAGVTALYGAQMDLGASWGVNLKWKIVPTKVYFNPWNQNRKQIGESAFFAGQADITSDEDPDFDIGVYVTAGVNPKIGIGVEYICAGVGAPINTTPEVHYMKEPQRNPPKHLKGTLGIDVGLAPFMEVTIPIVGKKIGTNITPFKIWDKTGDKAIKLFDIDIK